MIGEQKKNIYNYDDYKIHFICTELEIFKFRANKYPNFQILI